MEKDWVKIHTTDNIHHAESLRVMLSDNDIVAFIINKKDSNYHFGEIEIYTLPDSVMKSKLLIDKFER